MHTISHKVLPKKCVWQIHSLLWECILVINVTLLKNLFISHLIGATFVRTMHFVIELSMWVMHVKNCQIFFAKKRILLLQTLVWFSGFCCQSDAQYIFFCQECKFSSLLSGSPLPLIRTTSFDKSDQSPEAHGKCCEHYDKKKRNIKISNS